MTELADLSDVLFMSSVVVAPEDYDLAILVRRDLPSGFEYLASFFTSFFVSFDKRRIRVVEDHDPTILGGLVL